MGNFSFWLSKRLEKNKLSTSKTGSIIAVLGVAIAIAVMEITLSVSVGFKKDITSKLEGFVAPITVSAINVPENENTQYAYISQDLKDNIKHTVPENSELIGSILIEGLIKTEDNYTAIALKGYEPSYSADFEKGNIKSGRWVEENESRNIVISQQQANYLNLELNDKINFCYFINGKVKSRPMTIVGIYDSGFEDFDKLMAYTNYETLRNITHLENNQISVLEIRGIKTTDVVNVSKEIGREIELYNLLNDNNQQAYKIDNIIEQGGQYLSWLELLNTNVAIIFILMSIVAVCTVVSSLFIQVLEKVNTIGLLRALGAQNRSISRIFQYLTLKLVIIGLLIGNFVGIGFILVQSKWHIISLNSEMYFLNTVPVSIDFITIAILNIAAVLVSWLVLYIPAKIATKLSPAKTLRYD